MGDNMDVSETVRPIAIFGELDERESAAISERVVRLDLKRGQELVRQGDESDAVFVVLFGRFSVYVSSRSEPVVEISAGELIGEIGFFSGQSRTATVMAARDSAVAKLDRAAFYEIVAANPKIYQAILKSLAGRLAEINSRASASHSARQHERSPSSLADKMVFCRLLSTVCGWSLVGVVVQYFLIAPKWRAASPIYRPIIRPSLTG